MCKCIISRSTENRSQSELTNVKSALDSDSTSELELAPTIQVRGFGRFINNKKARRNFPLASHWHSGRTMKGLFSGSSGKIFPQLNLHMPLKWTGYEITYASTWNIQSLILQWTVTFLYKGKNFKLQFTGPSFFPSFSSEIHTSSGSLTMLNICSLGLLVRQESPELGNC